MSESRTKESKETNVQDIKTLNLYEKLARITSELGVLSKKLDVQVAKGKSYKAVDERTILDAIKPLEDKYRVFSYPIERKIIENDILTKETEYDDKVSRTNTLFMRLEITYRFINIDNKEEYIDIISYGDGMDTGDKAPGKAMTYADKYALMKSYKISTGDDPDKEASPENGYKSTNSRNIKKTNKKNDTTRDYRTELMDYLKKNNFDVNKFAIEHKLNANTTQEEAQKILEDLITAKETPTYEVVEMAK